MRSARGGEEKHWQELACLERMLGNSRPKNIQSATPMKTGVAARKTMNVSTLQNCSVLMLAKMHARKATETGKKACTKHRRVKRGGVNG